MKILFICTHNRCRSILAEAICNHYGDGLLQAVSAGSKPVGKVHPQTINALRSLNISTENLTSESWESYEDADIDYVITVCDKVACELSPVWFGLARQTHWGLEDPSAIEDEVEGYAETINAAFTYTIEILKGRIEQITTWLKQGLDNDELFKRIETLA